MLAVRQHGVFLVAQAIDAGASPQLIHRRLRCGAWVRLAPRVLAMAAAPRTWRQDVMAAVLEAGPDAVASHRAAAALQEVPGFHDGWVETQKVRGRNHVVRLSTVHETFWLPDNHTTVIDGIPCTSLARTVFDLASCVHAGRVERALDNSLARLGLSTAALTEVVAAVGRSGKAGTAVMRDLLRARTEGYVPPESELEALVVAVLAAHGLPAAERQVNVGDTEWIGRVDFVYREAKVIIEADGRPYHLALLDKERDEARRARLEADGWQVVVVRWRQLVDEPELVVRRIRHALERALAA
ncbi:MAG: DUF559 domain-containing protein [Actinomycetota bacterium]